MGIKSDSKERTTKRILVLTSTFPRWRSDVIPRFVFDLSMLYVQRGYEVDVIAPHSYKAKRREVMDKISVFRFKYFFDRYQNLAYGGGIMANLKRQPLNYLLVPFFVLFQCLAILHRLKKNRYDLIHAHWLIPQTIVCVLVLKYFIRDKIPVLCTSHGSDHYVLNGPVFTTLKRWVVTKCAHVCVVSNSMRDDLLRLGIDSGAVSVSSMGVDLQNLFVPVQGVIRYANRIIFVGRFVSQKGAELIIEAVDIVRKSFPNVEVILVGDGPARKTLEDKVKTLELDANVRFFGAVNHEKLPELYSSATIAVVPSVGNEGLGLVMIEAMGCGCAVVASALGPILEVIDHERTGLLFKPGDVGDLATQIQRLLEEPGLARSVTRSGNEKIRERFDWTIVAQRYCDLVEHICN